MKKVLRILDYVFLVVGIAAIILGILAHKVPIVIYGIITTIVSIRILIHKPHKSINK